MLCLSGTSEESSPAMPSKPSSSLQDTPTTSSYPDWSTSIQAYYGAGATPPPYFTSPVASSAPHQYAWGSQHLVTPYVTPLPYPSLYAHGGLYSHPNAAVGGALTNKASNGEDLVSNEKSMGTSMNTAGGKSGEREKTVSGSENDGASQSAETASEESSEASGENPGQQASSALKKRSFNQVFTDGVNLKSNNSAQYDGENAPASAGGKASTPTNLNIGMDLWNASSADPATGKASTNTSGASAQVAAATMDVHEGLSQNQEWLPDERELKREKRKQSNRESARRSRLRKQAECDELQCKVEKLNNENQTLRDELNRLAEECEKLTSENNSVMEDLSHTYGPDATSNLKGSDRLPTLHSFNGEHSSHRQETSVEDNSNSTSSQNGRLFKSNTNHDS
ncbi:hypothetical protein U1Q18_005790 [Sarracenia purpurea var. burkii]